MTIIYLEYISFELPARIYEDESAVIEISAILRLDMKLFYIWYDNWNVTGSFNDAHTNGNKKNDVDRSW